MGKSVIIHHEQFSSRYSTSAFICQLFEITRGGHRDISSKIFGNLGGENLVLSDNKVYFMSLLSMNSSGLTHTALVNCYRHLWHSNDSCSDLNKVFLRTLYEGFIDLKHKEKNTSWKKNPRAKDRNDFTFWEFNFDEYSKLSSKILYCVSRPSSMSEEEFEEYLIPYGGKEGFDPRVFLYDPDLINEVKQDSCNLGREKDVVERHTEALKYVLTSRSYILGSPVYITNSEIPGMLYIAERALKNMTSIDLLEAPISVNTPRGLDLYRKVKNIVSKKIQRVLDPERLIYLSLRMSNSSLYKGPLCKPLKECLERGSVKNPIAYKLSRCPDTYYSLTNDMIKGSTFSSWLPKNSFELQKNIIKEDINTLVGIDLALFESSVRTAELFRVAYNSTTYLAKDLLKIVDLVLSPVVRWKGSRAAKEKELCQYIFLLKCILKTPALLKDLLGKDFYSNRYKDNKAALIGGFITLLTSKDSVFSADLFSMRDPDGLLLMQADESYDFSKWVRIYINYPRPDVYLKMAEECVSVLEDLVNSPQVQNSVEHGIQVCSSGSLFRGSGSRDYYLQQTYLSYIYIFPYSPDNIVSYSFIEDVYYILMLGVTKHSLDIKEYISRVLTVLTRILEIKSSVALKTEESYYLNGPILKFLDASLWLSLQN